MPQDSIFFETYKPASHYKKITGANGNSVRVAGQGDARSSASLPLEDVLLMPLLSTNLIPARRLKKDLNYRVIFSHHDSVFQEIGTRRRIEAAKEQNGCTISKWITMLLKEISLLFLVHYKANLLLMKSSLSLRTPLFPFTSNSISFIV